MKVCSRFVNCILRRVRKSTKVINIEPVFSTLSHTMNILCTITPHNISNRPSNFPHHQISYFVTSHTPQIGHTLLQPNFFFFPNHWYWFELKINQNLLHDLEKIFIIIILWSDIKIPNCCDKLYFIIIYCITDTTKMLLIIVY